VSFKTFTAGAVLTASDVNTYLAKQAVVVCTSGGRPSSPPEGMVIYETDTDKLLTYTTSTTGWVPPWNMPWGRISSATSTAATTAIGASAADVNNLSVTFTAVANRYYKTTIHLPIYQQATSDGFVSLSLTDGSNAEQVQTQQVVRSGGSQSFTLTHVGTIASGSATRKARISVTAGSGTVAYAANYPALILVEDIGPSAAPA
jgi:hypothetical protein